MSFIDYYKLLGVQATSSELEIKEAYRKLSKKFHPDLNDGDNFFTERFKDIQAAYETLIDKDKRQRYNQEYDSFYKKSNTNSQKPNNEFFKNETYNVKPKQDKKSEPKTAKLLSIIIPIFIVIAFFIVRGIQTKQVTNKPYYNNQENQNQTSPYDRPSTSSNYFDSSTTIISPSENSKAIQTISSDNYPIGFYMVLASNDHLVFAHYKPDINTKFDFRYSQRSEVYIQKVENGFGYVDEGNNFNAHYWLDMNDLSLVKKDEMVFKSIKENDWYILEKLKNYVIEGDDYSQAIETTIHYADYKFSIENGNLIISHIEYSFNKTSLSNDTSNIIETLPIKDFEFPIRKFKYNQIAISSLNENVERNDSGNKYYSTQISLHYRESGETDLLKNLSLAFLKLKKFYNQN